MIDLDYIRSHFGDNVEHAGQRARAVGNENFQDNIAAVTDQDLLDNAGKRIAVDIPATEHGTDGVVRFKLDLSGKQCRK